MKNKLIGVSIITCLAIACGYGYDVYRTQKLLDLRQFEADELVQEALDLRLTGLILNTIKAGKAEELIPALEKHILEKQQSIREGMKNYELSPSQKSIIESSLKDSLCENEAYDL